MRGAASSLYGDDAIGGVINIITREPGDKALSAYANAGYGTYGTSRYDAGVSGAADGFSYSLSTGYGQTMASTPPTAARSRTTRTRTATARTRHRHAGLNGGPSRKWWRRSTAAASAAATTPSASYDYNDRYIQDLQAYSLASENRLTRYWKSTLRAGYAEDKNDSRAEGMFEDNNTRFRTRQMQYL